MFKHIDKLLMVHIFINNKYCLFIGANQILLNKILKPR
jgi:hypothetical protein